MQKHAQILEVSNLGCLSIPGTLSGARAPNCGDQSRGRNEIETVPAVTVKLCTTWVPHGYHFWVPREPPWTMSFHKKSWTQRLRRCRSSDGAPDPLEIPAVCPGAHQATLSDSGLFGPGLLDRQTLLLVPLQRMTSTQSIPWCQTKESQSVLFASAALKPET